MANTKKPADFTGQKQAELQRQQLEDQAQQASDQLAARAQAAVTMETEVVNATKAPQPTVVVDETIVVAPAVEETEVIRVVEDIEAMTFGSGNLFSFKAGVKYEVTKVLANHLRSKGYLSNAQ